MTRTIKTKTIVWYLIFVIIPFLTGLIILLNIGQTSFKENALSYMDLYSKQVDNNLEDRIEEYDRMMKSIMADKDVCYFLEIGAISNTSSRAEQLEKFENYRFVQQHFLKMITQQPLIEFIVILDNSRNIYPSLTYINIPDIEAYCDSIYYDRIFDRNGKVVVSSGDFYQYGLTSNRNTAIAVSRLLKNLDGKVIGVGSIFLDTTKILKELDLASKKIQYSTGIIIFDENNQLIIDSAEYLSHLILSKEDLLNAPIGANFLDSKNGEFMFIKQPQNRYGFTTITCVPTASLFSTSDYYVMILIIIVVLIGLFATAFLYLLDSHVTKPIKTLDQLTHEISNGNFDIKTNLKTNDEIGSLAANFELMALKVKMLINEVYLKDIKQKQAELAALQNQINPHFLYNTLESIRMKALINSDTDVAAMIKNLSRLFRITLDIKGIKSTLSSELKHAIAYVDILNMRYDNIFELIIDVPTNLMEVTMIKLIVQPLIENSILHGFRNIEEGGTIKINAFLDNQEVVLTIEDNGNGLNPQKLSELQCKLNSQIIPYSNEDAEKQSIGLKNIVERLRLEYQDQGTLTISSVEGLSFKVSIAFPYYPKRMEEFSDV